MHICTIVIIQVVFISQLLQPIPQDSRPCDKYLGVLVMGVFEPEGTRGVLLTPGVLVLEEATEVGVATSVGWVTEIAGVLGVELKMAATEGVLGVAAWELLAALWVLGVVALRSFLRTVVLGVVPVTWLLTLAAAFSVSSGLLDGCVRIVFLVLWKSIWNVQWLILLFYSHN